MAAPSFVGMIFVGGSPVVVTGSGDSSLSRNSGAAGNVFIMQVLQDGTATAAPTLVGAATLANIEALDGTDDSMTQISGPGAGGAWDVGSAVAARQYLWIGRAIAGSTPTTVGVNVTAGDDIYWVAYEFTDVNAGSTLSSVIENSSAGNAVNGAGTSTSVADTGVTTLGPDRLALNFVAINDDATGLPSFTGETGGDWAHLSSGPFESSTGTDGTVACQAATIASAGTINGGSGTITSDAWGVVGFALIGTTSAAPTSLMLRNRSRIITRR